ncbi:MAG: energy-coupling factor transporter ATPase [Clostridiales bacterium]|nr:energy-coupling factor transporter ATPase [Clostridiales bacterium]MBD5530566.1 energy-coupling factor transporter ATPase [Lachnospiraceae bacterium]
MAVELDHVTYSYNVNDAYRVDAIKDLSLHIEEGTFVALVGHNGSGKSTLAKLLNGLLLPTSGEVKIFGNSTLDVDKIYDIRKSVGMVFQNPDNQMIASIVEDDIAFGPENLGIERSEIERRVEWALSKVGMLDYRKNTPFKMSGGQKQRLAIAGVLAILPKILVLDESTAMLDPKGRSEVLKVAHELNKQDGITVIHITHFMEEALNADRLIVLDNGKIAFDDTPEEVFKRYDELKAIKLTVPWETQLAISLKKVGIDVGEGIVKDEELTDRICQLL